MPVLDDEMDPKAKAGFSLIAEGLKLLGWGLAISSTDEEVHGAVIGDQPYIDRVVEKLEAPKP